MKSNVDLHVHSKYSEHPSEWFLQRLGAAESYTEPDTIYRMAKQKGMRFVTITDHNRIDGVLELKEKYPEEVFTGVEATSYFPEDGCKIHILIYGFSKSQFDDIQHLRADIYQLRDYLSANDLAYSVAHASYSVNGRLKQEHLEKLILLFDVFEGINGGRNRVNNQSWMEILKHLTPLRVAQLSAKWNIHSQDEQPWIKGLTGGSDDHAGLFIGDTYTCSDAINPVEFLKQLKNKTTSPSGRHNNYKSLAFIIYKISTEFIKSKGTVNNNALFTRISDSLFEQTKPTFRDNLKYKAYRYLSRDTNQTKYLMRNLIDEIYQAGDLDIEEKFELLYRKISDFSDHLAIKCIESIQSNLKENNLFGLIQNMMTFIPGAFLSLPFFTSLKVMHNTRQMVKEMKTDYIGGSEVGEKRVLWFSDTLNDLNGVSVTLKKIGWIAHKQKLDISIVTAMKRSEEDESIPPNVVRLPFIFDFEMPYYEKYTLKLPSILRSLEIIDAYKPDEIVISTPGPIGLIGLLAARLWNIKSIGIYHTDFGYQAKEIINDESVIGLIDMAMKWFYSALDEVRVPTNEYISILEKRGLERDKMKLFQRGIDTELFRPDKNARGQIIKKYNLPEGLNLLYSGRVSKDKNLDLLLEIYRGISDQNETVNLLVAGDGPYLQMLTQKAADLDRCFMLGQIPREELVDLYAGSDLFLFPSLTDTFGMVVLEAQACGLPAIVSDEGGPKEIIVDGQTGFAVCTNNKEAWIDKSLQLLNQVKDNDKRYFQLCEQARDNVLAFCDWNMVINDLFNDIHTQQTHHKASVTQMVPA